jgi:predicted ABC-type transport system involved in lysophospholipase L1 biosynthesis ATPase subunit
MSQPASDSDPLSVKRSALSVERSAAGGAVLRARSVAKNYLSGTQRLEVLRGVDLEVAAGESVSIRGESGSGKSTLLNLLAGLDSADTGTLEWDGVADTGTERRAKFLGMVFQSFYLIPELNARANVLMAARILGVPGAAERARADELLRRVGLAERATHLPSQLSGGERQRVAVARALMNSPKLILADEPTGNLDEHTGDAVIDLLLAVCRETGTALALVTHNAAHAQKTNRQLFLREGKLVGVQSAEFKVQG